MFEDDYIIDNEPITEEQFREDCEFLNLLSKKFIEKVIFDVRVED